MDASAELLIRISTSLTMIIFGITQLIRPSHWLSYLPLWFEKLLPMKPRTFMREHGVGNVALGVLFLLNIRPEWVYWLVLIWWLSILPFAFYENWQSGMRDLVIIAAILALIIAS